MSPFKTLHRPAWISHRLQALFGSVNAPQGDLGPGISNGRASPINRINTECGYSSSSVSSLDHYRGCITERRPHAPDRNPLLGICSLFEHYPASWAPALSPTSSLAFSTTLALLLFRPLPPPCCTSSRARVVHDSSRSRLLASTIRLGCVIVQLRPHGSLDRT
ncbi:hypothetical protein BC827DRAFT_261623 [Russula dissimulans]|nr:hypothetical protein BC827DRAFT_261623 [Russula dissimulans]